MLIFGEKLNQLQWIGVLLAVVSFFMLSRSGKREGIDFEHNVCIYAVVGAAILGAVGGFYDKFLMNPDGLAMDKMSSPELVQHLPVRNDGRDDDAHLVSQPKENHTIPLALVNHIHLCIPECRRLRLSLRLVFPGAMISVVSMIRRGSVIVSFLFAAIVFREKNLRSKAIDLALVLLGMVFLYLGSR